MPSSCRPEASYADLRNISRQHFFNYQQSRGALPYTKQLSTLLKVVPESLFNCTYVSNSLFSCVSNNLFHLLRGINIVRVHLLRNPLISIAVQHISVNSFLSISCPLHTFENQWSQIRSWQQQQQQIVGIIIVLYN